MKSTGHFGMPTTAQAQERGPDCVGAGSIGTSVPLVIKKTNKNGLLHGNGHTSSRDRSRRVVLKREQRKQLENNHYQD
jgi:hypothetical protein